MESTMNVYGRGRMQEIEMSWLDPAMMMWCMARTPAYLSERLGTLSDRAQTLVSTAEAEGRDLTPSEALEIDSILAEARSLKADSDRAFELDALLTVRKGQGRRTEAEGPPPNFSADGSTRQGRRVVPDGGGVIVGKTHEGELIRAYRHGEKIPYHGPAPECDFQDFLRCAWRPADYPRIRAAVSEGGDGAYTVPTPLASEILDLVRAAMQVSAAGSLTIPMTSATLRLATLAADPTAYWRAELSAITASTPGFSKVDFTAKVVGALFVISEELLMDSPNAGAMLQQAAAAALAHALDKACLTGNGTSEPQGVYDSGEQQILAAGALTDFSKFTEAWGLLLARNFTPNALLYNGLTAALIDGFTDQELRPLMPPPSWGTYQHLVTNQIAEGEAGSSTDESTAFLGDWRNYWQGMRMSVDVRLERTGVVQDGVTERNLFSDLGVGVRVFMRADGQPVRPLSFVTIQGITTSESSS